MKVFYVDMAEEMWKYTMLLSHSFFGSSPVLFGTDRPWGDAPKIIESIISLDISEEKKMISADNAEKILH